MAITGIDGIVNGLATGQNLRIDKVAIANTVAGQFFSHWKTASMPLVGATPTTAELLSSSSTGSMVWANPTGGQKTYIGRVSTFPSLGGNQLFLVDRLGHMGGLNGTSVTEQTVDLNLTTGGTNRAARIGATDYSDLTWYLEWYADTGATVRNATVKYTNGAGTPDLTIVVPLTATVRASRMIPIQAADNISIVQSVTLDGSTGTAGNFGVTATRLITDINAGPPASFTIMDWQQLGLPTVEDSACLTTIALAGATTTAAINSYIRLMQG